MRFEGRLLEGKLVRRYKRFLADVVLKEATIEGERPVVTVHCPNSGSMLGCDRPGSAVRLSWSGSATRRYPLTLELVRVGRFWIGINTHRANGIVEEAIIRGMAPQLAGFDTLRREVPYGKSSRIDILLESGAKRCYVEVKNVTLEEKGIAIFPDSVTTRGLKHLHELARVVRRSKGRHRAAMVYLVQRGDCSSFRAAREIDPAYADALDQAAREGVEVYPLLARVGPSEIRVTGPLPWLDRSSR